MTRSSILGRGLLLIIAAGFVGSGLLRAWDGHGAALAREVAARTAEAGVITAACDCATDEGLDAALAAVRARETSVQDRENALSDRLAALDLAEQAIEARLAALEAAEAQLSATMARSETAAEDDLAQLTSVYENMKPKEAAELFQAMTPDFAAGFLSRMRADAAAAIFAGLPPETAYTISVILAGRNARAPTE
ncbi:MAG: hypothetical protein AAGJ74_03380 [Pseudomonadota bacterium]